MKSMMTAAAVTALILAGCAAPKTAVPEASDASVEAEQYKQLKFAVERQYKSWVRLNQVAMQIDAANAELCGDAVAPDIGVAFAKAFYEEGARGRAAREVLGGDPDAKPGLYVLTMKADGAAARAEVPLQARLLSLNGQRVPDPFDADDLPEFRAKSGLNELVLSADGEERTFQVAAHDACDFPVVYDAKPEINAYADGERIYVTRGMLDFADSDEELALVYAHELAHNTEEHIDSKRLNAYAGMAGGLVLDVALAVIGVNTQGALMRAGGNLGAGSYSQSFEREADYVGLYYMARAGYDTSDAATFWRRMGVENDSRAITAARTHPTTAERFVVLARANEEIGFKRGAGESLVPNYKEAPDAPVPVREPGQE